MKPAYRAAITATAVLSAIAVVPNASTVAAEDDCPLPTFGPGTSYHPSIDPEHFSPNISNVWLPMKPGTSLVYTGVKDGEPALDITATTSRTRVIEGVTTRIVEDRLYLSNVLAERTADYFAQDECGNVWYFGEDTAELDAHGHVISTEGSFHAGVDGAQPGVVMQAHPQIGRDFRQEWYQGEAEDQFRVVSLSARVTVPFGSFGNVMRTREITALEPGVVDNKYYVRGVGEVKEVAVKGPTEELDLVEIIR